MLFVDGYYSYFSLHFHCVPYFIRRTSFTSISVEIAMCDRKRGEVNRKCPTQPTKPMWTKCSTVSISSPFDDRICVLEEENRVLKERLAKFEKRLITLECLRPHSGGPEFRSAFREEFDIDIDNAK
jgi:hypothetical protein